MLLTTSGVGMPACAEPETIPFLSTYWNCFTNIFLHISVTYPVPGIGRIGLKLPTERYQLFFFFFSMEYQCHLHLFQRRKKKKKKEIQPTQLWSICFWCSWFVFSFTVCRSYFLITRATKQWGLLKQRIYGFCQHVGCLHSRSSLPWNRIHMIFTEPASQNTKQEMCPRSYFFFSPKLSSTHQSGSGIFSKKKSGDEDNADNSIKKC